MSRVLISFQYSVAALIDRRILLIHSAICEEVFQAVAETTLRDVTTEAPEVTESNPAGLVGQLKDFPIMIRILSLADGVEIQSPPELLVKWSNIAAICNLSDEQWTVIKKPSRKKRTKA